MKEPGVDLNPRLRHLLIDEEDEGERLDSWLAEELEDLSRSLVQGLIKDGQVKLNGRLAKASARLRAGDEIEVAMPPLKTLELLPENIPISMLYQDEDIVVIDKPKGMVVHPAQGQWKHTLVNALLYHIRDLSGINGVLRPGIVHRLDKDTSGLMVVAKNDTAHRELAGQLQRHEVNKYYMALVHGIIAERRGRIEAPIGRSPQDRKKMAVVADGRAAISEYQVLQHLDQASLVRVHLLTGRTHQIRVHFAYIKHPILGDPLYSSGKNAWGFTSQALHAATLGFRHPRSGEYMEFQSPLPPDMQALIDRFSPDLKSGR